MIKSAITPFLVLLFLLTGCQQTTAAGPALQKTEPPRLVLDPTDALLVQGVPGEPAAVYDRLDLSLAWHLPAGRRSADGRAYVAAVPQGKTTQLRHYLPYQPQPQAIYDVDGPAEVAAISANGRWAVFTTDPPAEATLKADTVTTMQVLDLKRKVFSERITLEGDFVVEGIDNVGRSIYLIEHLPERGDGNHYRVRVFDAQKYMLDLTPIRDKRFLDEVMAGYAWGTATDSRGRWLTTLYVNDLNDTAFIHALNLGNRWAMCLALPSKSENRELLKYYGLALTPEGNAVIAVNPLLGVLVEIDLDDASRQTVRSFDPLEIDLAEAGTPEALLTTTVSSDGQTAYFALGRDVWRYERASGRITGPYTAAEPVVDLALSSDEEMLLLAFNSSSLQTAAVDAAFGQLAAK